MPLSNSQLQGLWIQAGGSKQAAPTAAAIALAESSGDPQSHATQGEDSRGLWQINVGPGANTQYLGTNLWDPLTNAKVAVAMSGNGANWHPWTTYTKGTYQQFLQGLNPSSAPGGSQAPTGATKAPLTATPTSTSTSFDQSGFNAADAKYIAGSYLAGSGKNPFDIGPKSAQGFGGGLSLIGPGLLSTSAPNPADYTKTIQVAQTALQGLAGTPLAVHPAASSQAGGSFAGTFPKGVNASVQRHDMGRDAQGPANTPLLANGTGHVASIGNNPGGFGIAYPVIHYDTGPWAGLDVYYGHTRAAVSAGQAVTPGMVISHTQDGSGPYVGNATGLAGWVEIGLASNFGRGYGGSNPGPLPPGL